MKIKFYIAILFLIGCNWLKAMTITVGNTGNYPSVTAAIAALGTISEPLIIELKSDYAQTSESITAISGASASNTVTIRPQAILTITGSGVALWNLDGCQWVTIDGRIFGGDDSKALTLSNSSVAGITVRFINDASNNTIKYVNLLGVNSSITAGTVTFSTTTGTTGNDNNTIDHCDIKDAATTPTFGIYSLGSATNTNDGNIISNNNIYNYYNSTNATYGGYGVCLLGNTSSTTISGNSFYQTATRATFANSSLNGAVLINNTSGNGFIVKDNYIGGQASGCGAAGNPYISGSSVTTTQRFLGISMTVGNTSASYVYNNTFQNLSLFSGNTTPSTCISLQAGLIKCGVNEDDTPAGNIIGSSDASLVGTNASIIFTGTLANSYFSGIYINSSTNSTPIIVSNNNIGGITGTSTNITTSSPIISYLSGITVGSAGGISTYTISNNNIGNGAVGIAESSMSIQNFAARPVYGIHVLANNSTSIIDILGNNINNLANLAPNSSSTNSGYFGGIVTNNIYTQVNIKNNIVRDLSAKICSLSNTGTYPLHAGIAVLSQNSANTVSENTVYNLAGAKTMIDGILIANGGGTTVSRNNVYNVFTTSTSSGNGNAGANGIRVVSGGTYAPNINVNNNMIRLGYDRNGVAVTSLCPFTGIRDSVTTTATGSISYYYNTVYVGGNGVTTGTNPTFAFFTTGASGSNLTRNIQNNIFINARSSASGSNIHYAFKCGTVNGLNGTLNLDYNDYVANGTGGTLGYVGGVNRTSITELQTGTSRDSHSMSFNPVFVNSITETPDLHINSSNSTNNALFAGTAIESVKFDIDGTQRGLTPVIGADEFINQTLPPFISLSKPTVTVSFYRNSTASVDISSNVKWTAISNNSWLEVRPSIETTGNATLTFTAEANPDSSPRTAIITISATGLNSQTITVIQEPKGEADKAEYLQIILYGQSLSLGWQCTRAITTIPLDGNYMIGDNVNMMYNNGTTVLNPLVATKWSKGGEQPIVSCVNAFSKVYRDSIDATQKFIAMTGGEGGQSIENLSKNSSAGYYSSTFLRILDNTLLSLNNKTVSCPAILYMQGEGNSSLPTDKNVYKALLMTLKNNMQADIMAKYGQVHKPLFFIYQTSGKYTVTKEMPIVMAQREFASENPDVVLLNPHYAMPDYSGGHLSTNGYRWFGEIMAKSLSEVLVRKNTYKTLKPTDFDIQDNTINITYQVPVPPLVLDTWTTPKETNYGFTVYKNGAIVPVTELKITNDNHVLITCNSELTGIIDIVYAGNATNGSGNLRDSDNPVSMYTYYDDSADALKESYTPLTQSGGSIYGQNYGLQNWSDEFYYSFNVVTTNTNSLSVVEKTTAYPNPARDILIVTYNLEENQRGEFILFDAQGRQIYSQNISGNNKSISFKTDMFQPGLYFYKIKSKGMSVDGSKFVINR